MATCEGWIPFISAAFPYILFVISEVLALSPKTKYNGLSHVAYVTIRKWLERTGFRGNHSGWVPHGTFEIIM